MWRFSEIGARIKQIQFGNYLSTTCFWHNVQVHAFQNSNTWTSNGHIYVYNATSAKIDKMVLHTKLFERITSINMNIFRFSCNWCRLSSRVLLMIALSIVRFFWKAFLFISEWIGLPSVGNTKIIQYSFLATKKPFISWIMIKWYRLCIDGRNYCRMNWNHLKNVWKSKHSISLCWKKKKSCNDFRWFIKHELRYELRNKFTIINRQHDKPKF